ncbi:unnamed protein product [Amoebophrya sp. A120]|nr:unnamed protein product [Amoebophrya sp. A120]|eukprot:GSA120T00010343001.1
MRHEKWKDKGPSSSSRRARGASSQFLVPSPSPSTTLRAVFLLLATGERCAATSTTSEEVGSPAFTQLYSHVDEENGSQDDNFQRKLLVCNAVDPGATPHYAGATPDSSVGKKHQEDGDSGELFLEKNHKRTKSNQPLQFRECRFISGKIKPKDEIGFTWWRTAPVDTGGEKITDVVVPARGRTTDPGRSSFREIYTTTNNDHDRTTGTSSFGTFEISEQLPQQDSVLLLIVQKSVVSGVLDFQSFAFGSTDEYTKEAQVAFLNAAGDRGLLSTELRNEVDDDERSGRPDGTPRTSLHGPDGAPGARVSNQILLSDLKTKGKLTRQESVSFNKVYAVHPGDYELQLKEPRFGSGGGAARSASRSAGSNVGDVESRRAPGRSSDPRDTARHSSHSTPTTKLRLSAGKDYVVFKTGYGETARLTVFPDEYKLDLLSTGFLFGKSTDGSGKNTAPPFLQLLIAIAYCGPICALLYWMVDRTQLWWQLRSLREKRKKDEGMDVGIEKFHDKLHNEPLRAGEQINVAVAGLTHTKKPIDEV